MTGATLQLLQINKPKVEPKVEIVEAVRASTIPTVTRRERAD
jgi:hypothetical protein